MLYRSTLWSFMTAMCRSRARKYWVAQISQTNDASLLEKLFVEMFVIYLRDDVLKNFIGDKEYRSWAPLVYTIFFFVLFGNVLGLIPIFDLTGLIGKIGYKAEMLGKDNILYLLSKGGHTVTANVNVTFKSLFKRRASNSHLR